MREPNGNQQRFTGENWGEQCIDQEPATALLDFKKTIRIAVSGDVPLTAAEVNVIDAADFQ